MNVEQGRLIRVTSGRLVDVFDPKPEMFVLSDIAHALSNLCRFGGHVPTFYSVAEHSILVSSYSWVIHPNYRLEGLMHDATEAYLVDLPRPIKRQISQYKEIEDNLARVIEQRFHLKSLDHEVVKTADHQVLQREWDHLILTQNMEPLGPVEAEALFLKAFKTMAAERGIYEVLKEEGAVD